MTDNNQPFDPPLSAEERALWDCTMAYSAPMESLHFGQISAVQTADNVIHERRRRFGVPNLSPDELFRRACGHRPGDATKDWPQWKQDALGPNPLAEKPPTVPVEIDIFRAEVERLELKLTRWRKRLRPRTPCRGCPGCGSDDCPDALDELRADVARLTKERDELRVEKECAEGNHESCLQLLESARARAEKAEAELAATKEANELLHKGLAEAAKQRDAARADLAAVQPVLEAVVTFVSSHTSENMRAAYSVLADYADAQRAKRAGGAQ